MQTAARMRRLGTRHTAQLGNALFYILLTASVSLFFFPFFWTVSSSLKHPSELFRFPPTMLPAVPQWENYARVFEKAPFMLWIMNTLYQVSLSTAGTVLSASLAGYAFARFEFRGKQPLFVMTLGTMMLPAQVILIPQFVLFHHLGWINTLKPLWVPDWFGGGAFAIFLMRQFMMTLPRELDESAIIDGARYPRIFWSILLPLCKPAVATLAMITIISNWNNFMRPLIYLSSSELFTVALGLSFFRNLPEAGGQPMQHLLMAAALMSTAPLIVLFFPAQRYFVRGMVLSGIKG